MDRISVKEKARYLDIATGSAAELRTQIYIGYVPQETGKQWIAETKEISAMLVGLIRSLKAAQ